MKKILIVDDDPDMLINLKASLTKKGFHILTIEDGLSAIVASTIFHPDLILLDVHLNNNLDGREICYQLKHNDKTKDICVVMTSADVSKEEVSEVCEADDFIEKPFTLINLYSKIQAHIA